jgi:hypothetical protein
VLVWIQLEESAVFHHQLAALVQEQLSKLVSEIPAQQSMNVKCESIILNFQFSTMRDLNDHCFLEKRDHPTTTFRCA